MQWWNELVDWFTLSSTRPILFMSAVLFVSIAAAGILAAWIANSTLKHHIAQRDRELKSTAIGALIDAAIEASVWSSLTPQEQILNDRAVGQADLQLRLLPIKGSAIAADWAFHKLAEMKTSSAIFGYQLEPALVDFRDRLTNWQNKPGRTRKEFKLELERWRDNDTFSEPALASQQDTWVTQQHEQPTSVIQAATPGANTEAQQLIKDIEALATHRETSVEHQPLPAPIAAYVHSNADTETTPSDETAYTISHPPRIQSPLQPPVIEERDRATSLMHGDGVA
jgi:hypothetical protein